MALDDHTDFEGLLYQARQGEIASLGELLSCHKGQLVRLAGQQIGRLLQGKLDATDIVQEVFLSAHRDFHQFRGVSPGEFAGWLRQILATRLAQTVRGYLGTQARDPRLEREIADDLDRSSAEFDRGLVSADSTPSVAIHREEQTARLNTALEQLPEHYREVIALHHVQGLTLAEVARKLERTEDSVQKLWARALIRLREILGPP